MRPSTRLMVLAIGAFTVSMLAIAIEQLPDELGLYLWVVIGALLATDIAISRARAGWNVDLDGPREIFTNENGRFTLNISTPGRLPGEVRVRVAWPRGLEGPEEVRLSGTAEGAAAKDERAPAAEAGAQAANPSSP